MPYHADKQQDSATPKVLDVIRPSFAMPGANSFVTVSHGCRSRKRLLGTSTIFVTSYLQDKRPLRIPSLPKSRYRPRNRHRRRSRSLPKRSERHHSVPARVLLSADIMEVQFPMGRLDLDVRRGFDADPGAQSVSGV